MLGLTACRGGALGRRYAVFRPHLDERQCRLMLGSEAAELGRGGIKTVVEPVSTTEVFAGVGGGF